MNCENFFLHVRGSGWGLLISEQILANIYVHLIMVAILPEKIGDYWYFRCKISRINREMTNIIIYWFHVILLMKQIYQNLSRPSCTALDVCNL